MADRRQPWLRFYTADWRGDAGLRAVGFAARGLWMDMLSLMHEATPYGHLVVNATPLDAGRLASRLGGTAKEVQVLLDRLEEEAVFSRTDAGAIYSRRMVRDAEKADRDRQNGSGGGNPRLREQGVNPQDGQSREKGLTPPLNPPDNGRNNPPDKGGVNPPDKAHAGAARASQIPETRKQEQRASHVSLRDGPPAGSAGVSPPPGEQAAGEPAPKPAGVLLVGEALGQWNAICAPTLSEAKRWTDGRKRAVTARLRDDFGDDLDEWRAYLRRILASPFLTGGGERGWKADLDWALKPANVAKVLEGSYDPKGPATPPPRPTGPVDGRYFDQPAAIVARLPKPALNTPEYHAFIDAGFGRSTPHPSKRKHVPIA